MADIELRRVHDLGLATAKSQAERLSQDLARKFDLSTRWEGNVLRFERPGVTGSLSLTEKDLSLSVALGFLLKAMRGSIQSAVEQQLDELFAKAQAAPGAKAKKPAPPPKKGG